MPDGTNQDMMIPKWLKAEIVADPSEKLSAQMIEPIRLCKP